MSLCVVGASRFGKTQWARSLGLAMYFCGLFNLGDWDDEALFAIFDDIDIRFFPHWRQFLGAQERIVITDKYHRKETKDWGKPCIWLCNRDLDPRDALSGAAMEWWRANVITVVLTSPLFCEVPMNGQDPPSTHRLPCA